MANIKKITVAGVWGKIDVRALFARAEGDPLTVMKVGGTVVGEKIVPSPFGDSTALQGNFVAYHPETGEEFKSAVLYLPDVALIPIKVALAQPGARGIEFAIALQVRPAEAARSAVPYEYTFVDLLPVTEKDPLSQVRALLTGAGPAQLEHSPAANEAETPAPAAKVARKRA